MRGRFDAIRNLLDVQRLEQIRLFVVGLGSVGMAFDCLAIHHGIKNLCLIDPDVVSARNFASGFSEKAVGQSKAAYVETELKRRRKGLSIGVAQLALTLEDLSYFHTCLAWCTHVAFFADAFGIVTELVKVAYPVRPCLYAALLDRGQVAEAAWSAPGRTPCLNCTARLFEKQGVSGGETLLVDVSATVNVALRQFLGLCLAGPYTGFELFRPFVHARYCLALVVNGPGVRITMPQADTPCGVRLVEVVDEHGRGPSCPTCQGYRP
jgi:molybdopterin/thiamine biosynthesis adenylyltransferase